MWKVATWKRWPAKRYTAICSWHQTDSQQNLWIGIQARLKIANYRIIHNKIGNANHISFIYALVTIRELIAPELDHHHFQCKPFNVMFLPFTFVKFQLEDFSKKWFFIWKTEKKERKIVLAFFSIEDAQNSTKCFQSFHWKQSNLSSTPVSSTCQQSSSLALNLSFNWQKL